MVEQAVRMMCQEGNVTMMETQSIMMETILSLPARGLQEEAQCQVKWVFDKDPLETENLLESVNIPTGYPQSLKEDEKNDIFNQHLPNKGKTLNGGEI